jgi:hypothetical protein
MIAARSVGRLMSSSVRQSATGNHTKEARWIGPHEASHAVAQLSSKASAAHKAGTRLSPSARQSSQVPIPPMLKLMSVLASNAGSRSSSMKRTLTG